MRTLWQIVQIHMVAHLLAKRIKPEYKFTNDRQWNEFVSNTMGDHKCLICDRLLVVGTFTDHAIQHIKEHNLTVFI